jgi:hypothetical protein
MSDLIVLQREQANKLALLAAYFITAVDALKFVQQPKLWQRCMIGDKEYAVRLRALSAAIQPLEMTITDVSRLIVIQSGVTDQVPPPGSREADETVGVEWEWRIGFLFVTIPDHDKFQVYSNSGDGRSVLSPILLFADIGAGGESHVARSAMIRLARLRRQSVFYSMDGGSSVSAIHYP